MQSILSVFCILASIAAGMMSGLIAKNSPFKYLVALLVTFGVYFLFFAWAAFLKVEGNLYVWFIACYLTIFLVAVITRWQLRKNHKETSRH